MQPRRLVFLAVQASLFISPLALSGVALAGKVAVLAPQLKPPGANELRDRFHDAAVRGLARVGDGLMSAADVRTRLAAQPDLLNCAAASCAARAAAALHVDRIVTVEVEDLGKDYSIHLRVFDAAGQEVGPVADEHCDICTIREATRAGERVADRAVPVVEKGLSHAATATKTIPDDEEPPMHETPVRPVSRPPVVVVTPEQPLSPQSPPPEGEKSRTSGYRIGGYTALGVGAVSLGTMIGFAVFAAKEGGSGQYSCSAANPQYACPSLYKGNTGPAVAFGVIGGAAVVTGAVLLYLDWKHQKRPAVSVGGGPIKDGFALSTSVEF